MTPIFRLYNQLQRAMEKASTNKWEYHAPAALISKSQKPDPPKIPSNFNSLNKVVENHESYKRAAEKMKIDSSFSDFEENSRLKNNFSKQQEREKQRQKMNEKEKDKRRSRNDPKGRDYNCGCGKRYLSYPALFLHIQQKHGGVEVEGTNKSLPGANHKRGRPKKNPEEIIVESQRDDLPENLPDYVPDYQPEQPPREVSKRPIPSSNLTKSSSVERVALYPLVKQSMHLFEDFCDVLQGSSSEHKIAFTKFYKHIKFVNRPHFKKPEPQMSIDEAMAIFLYNMASECSTPFLNLLEGIFINFRACINEHYSTMAQNVEVPHRIFHIEAVTELFGKNDEYTETNSCEFVPLLVEYFVTKYAVTHMDKTDFNMLYVVVLDFCAWIYNYQMSRFKLSALDAPKTERTMSRKQDNSDEEPYYD